MRKVSILLELLSKCNFGGSAKDPRRVTMLYIGLYLEVLRGGVVEY